MTGGGSDSMSLRNEARHSAMRRNARSPICTVSRFQATRCTASRLMSSRVVRMIGMLQTRCGRDSVERLFEQRLVAVDQRLDLRGAVPGERKPDPERPHAHVVLDCDALAFGQIEAFDAVVRRNGRRFAA